MRSLRLSLLLLCAAVATARASDARPLEPERVEALRQYFEWALDLRLTEADYRQLEQHLAARHDLVEVADHWPGVTRLAGEERERLRAQSRAAVLTYLRGQDDALARWLLSRHEQAHFVLVPGGLPLTQVLAEKKADYWEWLLDLRLSPDQRRELRALEIDAWKNADLAWQKTWAELIPVWWNALATIGPVNRTLLRVQGRTNVLAELRGQDNPYNRWLLGRYEEARRPGSALNPVLVAGDPALTQDMVNAYAEYVEWRWRLTLTGLGAQQRQSLQRHIASDFRRRDRSRQQAFLADLAWWRDVFPTLSEDRRRQVIADNEHMGAYIACLRGDAVGRLWVNGLEALTLETLRWQMSLQNQYFAAWRSMLESSRATSLNIVGNMAPSGRYEHDPVTGGYDRYVPYPRW
jgi:hypothetical protein